MGLDLKKGYKQLVAEAEAAIESISVEEVLPLVDDEQTVIVDLRDVRELKREGRVPGALHIPRGMLEFWIDPDSPYHRDVFTSGKRFVFYCSLGWRSALATKTAQDMGLSPVCHMVGGFDAWRKANGPVEQLKDKSK